MALYAMRLLFAPANAATGCVIAGIRAMPNNKINGPRVLAQTFALPVASQVGQAPWY